MTTTKMNYDSPAAPSDMDVAPTATGDAAGFGGPHDDDDDDDYDYDRSRGGDDIESRASLVDSTIVAFPTFTPQGKFAGYEPQAAAPVAAFATTIDPENDVRNDDDDDDDDDDDVDAGRRRGRFGRKTYVAVALFLPLLVGIVLALSLSGGGRKRGQVQGGGGSLLSPPSSSSSSSLREQPAPGQAAEGPVAVYEAATTATTTTTDPAVEELLPNKHQLHTPKKDQDERQSNKHHTHGKGNGSHAKAEPSSSMDPLHVIAPSALTTARKSHPNGANNKWGATDEELASSVVDDDDDGNNNNNERISFIKYDLSSLPSDRPISKATLNLYLTTHHEDGSEEMTVAVDALPNSGDWSGGALFAHDDDEKRLVETADYFHVDSFTAVPLESSVTRRLYEVDVTSAIDASSDDHWITFRLSTESGGRLYFGSEEWDGGEAAPELLVTLSSA